MKLEKDPNQAAIVHRIFERYVASDSLKRIAIDLNDEGILSPQPQKGIVSRSWCPSSVRHILHNERYRGVVIWGKTQKIRSQETGKRIYRRTPPSECRWREIPEQRIGSEELWTATRQRMQVVERLYRCEPGQRPRGGRSAGSPNLFTGLLECSVCRGSITIVSGRWRKRDNSSYSCSMHAYRGDRVCPNNLLVAQSALEKELLAGLQAKVLHPEVIEFMFSRFEQQLARSLNERPDQASSTRVRLQDIKGQIRNCTHAIATMGLSNSLRDRLTDLEREQQELNAKMASFEPHGVRLGLRNTRRFVEARLRNVQSIFDYARNAGLPEVRRAREEIAKHVQKITLTPLVGTYLASGIWDWFGVLGTVAAGVVPGARLAHCSHGSITPQITFRIEVAA